MTKKNTGGAAFPKYAFSHTDRSGSSYYDVSGGMTLRDWFAGQALAGMLSRDSETNTLALQQISEDLGKSVTELNAMASYQIADAMLAARGADQ